MTLPMIALGFLASTLMGAAFHLWKGGGFGRLVLYLMLGWVGFWAGHLLGNRFELTFGSVGPLRLGMAILVGILTLLVGHWLSQIRQEEPRP